MDSRQLYNLRRLSVTEAAKPLVERLYMVRLRFRDSVSQEEIKAFGMPTTGDAMFDQGMHDDFVDRYINIFTMHQYFKDGTPFRVAVHGQTKEIYEAISDYLHCCKNAMDNVLNSGGMDVELLLSLDRFASSVYDHAVEHFTSEFVQSKMLRKLSSLSGSRVDTPKAKVEEEVDPNHVKRHTSLASGFTSSMVMASTGFKFNGG